VSILQFNTEHGSGEYSGNFAFNFNNFRFGHIMVSWFG
jgi:hypothetical protein